MAQDRMRSVQLWLPLLPSGVALVLLALVIWASERIVGDELERRSAQRVTQAAELYADQLSRVLGRRAAELELLAAIGSHGVDDQRWRTEMQRLKVSSPSYVWIGVTDASGRVAIGTDGLLEGTSIVDRPVFVNGRRGLWFGTLHAPVALVTPLEAIGAAVPRELADIALPVPDAQGNFRGVMAGHLDAAYLDALRNAVIGPAEGRRGLELALVDGAGRTLLGARAPMAEADWAQARTQPLMQSRSYLDGEGRANLLARSEVRPVDSELDTDWQVVAWQPLDAAQAPVRELERTLLFSGGATALLLGGLGFWLSRRLARPYGELLDAVAERLGPQSDAAPGRVLRVIAEQMRRLPPTGQGSRSEQTLAQVLHDASRLQAVLDHLPAPVYLVDMDFRVVYWNRAAEQMFGWTAEEAQGRHIADILEGDARSPEREAMRRSISLGAGPWTFEAQMQRRDGSDIWGEWRLTKVFGADGLPVGVIAQVRDLTAERQGELRLREQGEVLSAVINAASDAVISVDLAGRITLFNPAAARIFGRDAVDMVGQSLEPLLPAMHRGHHLALMHRFAESSTTTRPMGFGRVKGLRADGTELELEASISQINVRGQKLLTAILRDVTERVRAEQALARYQLELSDLTQRLLQQEQITTRELAQTLHDQLGQTLGAIRLSYDVLGNLTRDQLSPRALDRARTVGQQIDQAITEVRQALVKLRPPLLEEAGLFAALDNEVRQRAPEADPVRLELSADDGVSGQRWPENVEYAAFMVAREALANALQHARATCIGVSIAGDGDHLQLDVADDGIGLSDELAQGRPGHLGMVGMRERALAIGARLQARARPEGGTLITLVWTARPDSAFGSLDPFPSMSLIPEEP